MANAIEQIAIGRAFIEENGVDLANSKPAVISLYPHLAGKDDHIELVLVTAAYAVSGVDDLRGLTVDTLAMHLANTSGAFPWDGPYGNGLTRDQYQNGFRTVAADYHFLAGQMGLI